MTARIFAASIVLAVLIAAAFAVLVSSVGRLRTASKQSRETERAVALANRTEKLVVDLETGDRGFVITGQERFLDPYLAARRALPTTLSQLQHAVASQPAERARATVLAQHIREYERNWGERILRVGRRDRAAARALIATGQGKSRIDRIRREFAGFIASQQRVLDERRARTNAAGSRANWLGIAGVDVTFFLIAIFAVYLARLVVQPIRSVARCARDLAQGNLSVRVPISGAGEVGELGRDFNSMASSLERQQAQLARQNTELQAVLDATVDSILMTDGEGNVLFTNRKMDRFWGELDLPDEGTIWDRLVRLASLTTTPNAYFGAFERIASDPREVVEGEFTLAQDKRTFVAHTAPVTDVSGAVVGRIYSIRDVTAERLSERAKDEFVAAVSHELRTPLTSIRGYVELLLDGEADSVTAEQRQFLEVVERNAARLQRIVGDLLFVAQAEAGAIALSKGNVDLVEVIDHALVAARPAAEERGIAVAYDGPPHLEVEGDASRLAQVVDNLLSNAVKFTQSGTRVTVSALATPAAAVLEFEDAGVGIDMPDQKRLFERFFRTTRATDNAIPGTGLGLSIVKAIVEAHGGTIAVRSAVGEGTTVRVEFPRRAESRAA